MMIALAVAVLGCGGKKSDGGGGGGGGGGKAKDADPAAANAAVPAELKGKLEFDTAKDAKDGVAWVKPKGWKEGAIPGMVKPPDDASLGFMTKYAVGTNCDGTCEPKDWAATVDKVEFAQLASAGTVEKDELTYSLHIMVRYELEKALMQGTLTVADLPAAARSRSTWSRPQQCSPVNGCW